MESLSRLFDHMAWADRRTFEALSAMPEAPRQSLDLFAHLLAAEHVWLRRIENKTPAYEIWPRLSLPECERLSRANHEGYRKLLASTGDETLRAPVNYANSTGRQFATPLRDILLHVTHHGMYHRGQVAMLVRAAGGTPLATDFIAFVRE
jgi:uncharacterized damage-inducible protein DinB